MSHSSNYPWQLPFLGQNSFGNAAFDDCHECAFPKLPSFINILVKQKCLPVKISLQALGKFAKEYFQIDRGRDLWVTLFHLHTVVV